VRSALRPEEWVIITEAQAVVVLQIHNAILQVETLELTLAAAAAADNIIIAIITVEMAALV